MPPNNIDRTDQREKWTIEEMSDFSTKLGFVQCEMQQSVEIFQENHEVRSIATLWLIINTYFICIQNCHMLLLIYQELKFLGHPEYQNFTKIFPSCNKNALKDEVMYVCRLYT